MIDIHCHILPGIDDGPLEMMESEEMARMAGEDGIKAVVASPHFLYGERPAIEDIRRALLPLRKSLKEAAIPVELVEGADVKLTYELMDGIRKRDMPTINGSRYFLLELPEIVPPNIESVLFQAQVNGFVPIITHPERNYSYLCVPGKVDALRDGGALIQITAMSITGEFGTEIQALSHMLVRKGFVDFVATDAHDTVCRRPVLSEAYNRLSRVADRKQLERIFFENPQAVLEDRRVVPD